MNFVYSFLLQSHNLRTFQRQLNLTKAVIAHALKRGLILLSCGMHGNALRIMVPLTASDEIIAEGLEIFEAALADAMAELHG